MVPVLCAVCLRAACSCCVVDGRLTRASSIDRIEVRCGVCSVLFSSVQCVVLLWFILFSAQYHIRLCHSVNIVAFWVGVGRKGAPHLYLDSVGVSS